VIFEGSEPAGVALRVRMQRRKPKLVQPCPRCVLGVSVEQAAETAAGFCFGRSRSAPEESLGTARHFCTVGGHGKRARGQGCLTVWALSLLLVAFIARIPGTQKNALPGIAENLPWHLVVCLPRSLCNNFFSQAFCRVTSLFNIM